MKQLPLFAFCLLSALLSQACLFDDADYESEYPETAVELVKAEEPEVIAIGLMRAGESFEEEFAKAIEKDNYDGMRKYLHLGVNIKGTHCRGKQNNDCDFYLNYAIRKKNTGAAQWLINEGATIRYYKEHDLNTFKSHEGTALYPICEAARVIAENKPAECKNAASCDPLLISTAQSPTGPEQIILNSLLAASGVMDDNKQEWANKEIRDLVCFGIKPAGL